MSREDPIVVESFVIVGSFDYDFTQKCNLLKP